MVWVLCEHYLSGGMRENGKRPAANYDGRKCLVASSSVGLKAASRVR